MSPRLARIILKILYWLPAVLYMALIFYLSSSQPPQAAREVPAYFDIKMIHIVEYGVLNLLVFFALDRTSNMPFIWKIIYSVAITILYGLTDELHQVFVPGRSGKLIDVAANLIGCAIAQAGVYSFRVKFPGNNDDI